MKKIIINRDEWDSGEYGGLFYHSDLKVSCVVGHYLRACGMELGPITDTGDLKSISINTSFPEETHWLLENYQLVFEEITDINDSDDLTQDQKEKLLIKEFKKHDVELTFVD